MDNDISSKVFEEMGRLHFSLSETAKAVLLLQEKLEILKKENEELRGLQKDTS